ncbi:MAG: hypothetical protein Q9P14_03790 [candidate division KSB1 bacterium]|nr:hypothetical protein [candidate division KSB1 bacterium]
MQQTHSWVDAIRAIYAIPGPIQILEDRQQSVSDRVQWRRLRIRWQDAGHSFGLCLNTLRFPAVALRVFVTRFHESGRRRLFEDEALQRAIAHAYWQTTWAGSAIRVQRGETWPVAFVPIHRPVANQAPPAFREPFSLGARHWIFGRERWLLWQLQRLAEQGRLFWQDGRFDADADPEWLAYLQARGFIDQFIGDNRSLSGRRRIEKLVPVHGSHLLTRLASGEAVHFSAGNIDPQTILAATNSGFFLNFPEEYGHSWAAMNDPVGLFIEHGEIAQLPIVRRGALLVDTVGRATVARVSMRHVALRLPWETAWRECEQAPRLHAG